MARVAASYLVLDSPKNSSTGNLAKNVFLVPVQSFRMAIHKSFHAQLQQVIPATADDYAVDDVGSLTASQLNEVLEDWSIKMTPQPNDGSISQWLGNFIENDFYEIETWSHSGLNG